MLGAHNTSDVKLRTAPSTDSPTRPFLTGIFHTQQLPFVPKNTAFDVIGRTEQKVRVLKWENYW
jgi:hypothetical protein